MDNTLICYVYATVRTERMDYAGTAVAGHVKSHVEKEAPKDHPMKNLVQVPFFPTPVQPNTVLDKVTMPNQGGAGCRVWVINPDNGLCVTDPETGELHSSKQKLEPSAADVLR